MSSISKIKSLKKVEGAFRVTPLPCPQKDDEWVNLKLELRRMRQTNRRVKTRAPVYTQLTNNDFKSLDSIDDTDKCSFESLPSEMKKKSATLGTYKCNIEQGSYEDLDEHSYNDILLHDEVF